MRELTVTLARTVEQAPLPIANLYVVLHDIDLVGVGRGDAEVFPGALILTTIMREAWQRYWALDLIFPNAPAGWTWEQKCQAWRGITTSNRALCNGHGTDLYHDYISNRNVGAGDPAWEKTRVCGGNVVNVLDEAVTMIAGKAHLTIETLKAVPSVSLVNYLRTPWLVHLATTANGGTVSPFPQLDGHDVPFPVVGPAGYNYIEQRLLRKLPTGSKIPCPYVPARW